MNISYSTPTQKQNYNQVESIALPSVHGLLQILENHAEAFFLLQKGEAIIKLISGGIKTFTIDEGVCHVKENEVVIIS